MREIISSDSFLRAEAKRDMVFSFLVVFAAFAVYSNSLGNGFVWDDNVVIVANAALRDNALSLFNGIDAGREIDVAPYYRPFTMLTFLIEAKLHILKPFPMHLFNIILHAANAFLFYRLAKALTNDTSAALLAGLLFAVHPINTESVNFLSGGRNTVLACFFALLAYLLHHSSVERHNYAGAIVGSVFFLAALFSKETSLGILPFILMVELSSEGSGIPGARRRSFVRLLPYALFILFYLLLRDRALSGAGVRIEITPGLATRLLNNLYIIPRYILSVIWPPSVSSGYPIPGGLSPLVLPLSVAWLGIMGALGWLLTRGRSQTTIFGLSWFVAFWLPVSGLISFPSAPMADRYLYLPALGLWLVVADQVARLRPFDDTTRKYILVGAALLLMAALTVKRNPDWRSDVTLFTRYVEQYPDRALGHHNLGSAYLDQAGDLDSAEREFGKALALDPFFPRLQTQMGYVRLLRGDHEGALRYYNEALRQVPSDAEALLNRALELDKLGQNEAALDDYKRFLASPGNQLPGARPHAETRIHELSR